MSVDCKKCTLHGNFIHLKLKMTWLKPCDVIFIFSVEGELRIIRGCGWVPNEGNLADRTCFRRAGTNEVRINCLCDVITKLISMSRDTGPI